MEKTISPATFVDLRLTRPKSKRQSHPDPKIVRETISFERISLYGRLDENSLISHLNPPSSNSIHRHIAVSNDKFIFSNKSSKEGSIPPNPRDGGVYPNKVKLNRLNNESSNEANRPKTTLNVLDMDNMSEGSKKRLHAMIINFLELNDNKTIATNGTEECNMNQLSPCNGTIQKYNGKMGTLSTHINLHQYSLDSGSIVTNTIVQELCTIQPNIEVLDLTDCNEITDVSLWAIARYCNPKSLKHLILSNCHRITNVGLRSLSLKCYNIEIFNFNDCIHLDDLSLTVIASGGWRLKELYLRNCGGITDSGIGRIARMGAHLEVIDLFGCSG